MEFLSDTVVLSRIQFALTAIFHMLWPVITTGMAIYLVIVEGLWLKTRNRDYYYHARFWSKLYVLNFGIGVASGLPMEFQFGTNWAPFSEAVGDFFGSILGFEGSMAFMLEAGFLGIMLFGWERVNPRIHYLATIMVAFGANLSTFWILTANSWLQTPSGTELVNGKFIVNDYFQAILNPFMAKSFLHMFFATLETSLFVIGGISAWYILNQRHPAFFAKSFKIVLAAAIAVTPLQIYIGHLSAEQVYHYQPTKLAAIEAKWETTPAGETADWTLLAFPNEKAQKNDWELSIPNGLGYVLEFKKELSEPVLGLKYWKPEDRPRMVGLIYYAFRIMSGIGFFLAGLMLVTVWQWWRGKLSASEISQQRWLLRAWLFAAPLGYIAVESGWIVRCVGRQPWTVYGQIRTVDAASHLPPGEVLGSLLVFTTIYTILLISALYFGSKIIRQGPNLELSIPGEEKLVLETTPATHIPDSRPL
ncbi:cytochrome ubiquinol oxidase subunit I [Planktothrix agardhii 1029]|jgi:cytochrome bd ubiquinol oxidase subunit I|uniref:cytochrome ubiquinol oxidase subunit I n=1 Tax=Planktothrix agardhii TaxID=1160 RepID=UPI001D0AAF2C|nr:cytochrome ubiquinol oxidase subunit I [Planktothrix agardhii]MCB8762927.1 cytochrome ubiquinol oxidase subunit I [Planktothrix agardhii 1809]MCB8780946.1 cytochrome ubiquinol oxidase subunit I [Planktothrix agardhii 1808]MCF3567867.1 cytochrome ubiquinol oxidase subunit I [Planktothrix agardhii 1807]MCF3591200.1 cytochrome ubiquinol oxidase subunit I [Planktothrix agardhii 1029]MCF3619335.1 cytochrome ubiquinol oxidase subunit I [Planktothrix agardhii 1030]